MNSAQPRVRSNDWSTLRVPALSDWTPHLTVSVIVPTFRDESTLPLTLAALSAQSYPEALTEVIVSNDDETTPVVLPSDVPKNLTVVSDGSDWGSAHARCTGAKAASGDVLLWLDSDMLPFRHHIEAQMRWHHLIDYAVVLGDKRFVDFAAESYSPGEVAEAIQDGAAGELFAIEDSKPHEWVERRWSSTDDLKSAGDNAWSVHVGATASISRALYEDAGGMDPLMKLGEDIEFGYRAAQAGAVFIPDRESQSWHLGLSTIMQTGDVVNQFNAPFLADRIALHRWRRRARGRQYRVPYCQIVLDAVNGSFEAVSTAVDSWLRSSISDIEVCLLGPWRALENKRRSPIQDERRELRMLAAAYGSDTRVSLVDSLTDNAFPIPFRLHAPRDVIASESTLELWIGEATKWDAGLVNAILDSGETARLERTAAVVRAARLTRPGEVLEDAIDAVWGVAWCHGDDVGLAKPGK